MEKITYGITLLPNKRNTPYPIYINVRCRALNIFCRFATGLKIHPSIWNITTKRGVMCNYVDCDTVFEINYKINCICLAIEHNIKRLYKSEHLFDDATLLKNEIQKFKLLIKENAQKLPTFVKTISINEDVAPIKPKYKLMSKKINNISKLDIIKDLRKYSIDVKRKQDNNPSKDDKKYQYGDNWQTLQYLEKFFETYGNKQYKNLELLATTQGVKAFQNYMCDVDKCGKQLSATTVNKYVYTLIKLLKNYYCTEKDILKNSTIVDIAVSKLENKTDTHGNEIALTVDELWQLYNYTPEDKKEEIAKDTLLFLCCSSVRISDSEDMLDTTLKEFAQKKTVKRQSRTFVFEWAEEIIEKWQKREDKPIISKKKGELIQYMKQVAKNAGISGEHTKIIQHAGKKPTTTTVQRWECVATHTGRRTFATLCWLMGMNINKIGEYTCQTEKMVKHYIKADQKTKDDFEEDVVKGNITLPPYKSKYFSGGVVGGVANYIAQQPKETTQQPMEIIQTNNTNLVGALEEQITQKITQQFKFEQEKEEIKSEIEIKVRKEYDFNYLVSIGITEEEAKKRVEQAYKLYPHHQAQRQRVLEGWEIEWIEEYYQ